METQTSSLFERIGAPLIEKAVRNFYDRAFEDPIIQHFFIHSNKESLIQIQITFVTALLGGARAYQGKPLQKAHAPFSIRKPHFRRRQIIMNEVLMELGIAEKDRLDWIRLEESFKPLVMNAGLESCEMPPHLRGVATTD